MLLFIMPLKSYDFPVENPNDDVKELEPFARHASEASAMDKYRKVMKPKVAMAAGLIPR